MVNESDRHCRAIARISGPLDKRTRPSIQRTPKVDDTVPPDLPFWAHAPYRHWLLWQLLQQQPRRKKRDCNFPRQFGLRARRARY